MKSQINKMLGSEMITEKFVWLSTANNSSNRHYTNKDITITECKPKSDSKNRVVRYNITLRNKVPMVLGEYVDLAVYKNRIFLKASTQKDGGYKVYGHFNTDKDGIKKRTNPFLQVSQNDTTKILSEFVGDYDLQWDEFLELYYIERL